MHNPLWARVLSVTLQNIPISSFLFLWFVSLNDSYLELVFSIQKMRKKVQEKLRKVQEEYPLYLHQHSGFYFSFSIHHLN
jgi:hypothetical protein